MVLENLFSSYLARSVREGTLEIRLPGGRRLIAGDGGAPQVAVRIKSLAWALRIVLQPEVAVGDAYMAGALVVERGDIFGLLDLAGRNFRYRPDVARAGPLARWWEDVWRTHNARRQARRNVEHHYDLRAQFYRRFLDEDMQYSCAYFARPGASLEEAQLAKERHIAAKLLLHEGLSVLDVGCGWGGLALRLAADTGARVHGVTLAPTQLQTARENAEALGLASRAKFTLTDYRDVVGQYDRVVSVGMLEHVGRPNYQA
jgi:cyclopropane-fatty-acyl-phospholipid synthase